MSKASETALATLHSTVAKVLTEQVGATEAETIINEDGEYEETGQVVSSASPATIAAAIKFLKDNSITCDIEQDENIGALKTALENKTRHSRMPNASEAAKNH